MKIQTKTVLKLSTYFENEHERLEGLLAGYQQFKLKDSVRAKEYFQHFRLGLRRHIRWEEQIFFPLFEQKNQIHGTGFTEVMRMEHWKIGNALETLHRKVKSGDPFTSLEEDRLICFLKLHNNREENVLYPAFDKMLTAEELAGVYSEMIELRGSLEEACHDCQSACAC